MNQADLTCESAAIFFSSWRPHFDASASQGTEKLDHPVWMQVVNLCQVLRDDTFLHTIGEQIGQVISIDNSEAYRAKLFGPRIRLLVRDLDTLPHTVILPRLDGEGTIEYALEFSGLPNQCGRCRSREHQVRYCPRKEFAGRHKPTQRTHLRRQDPPARQEIHTSPQQPPDPPLEFKEKVDEQGRDTPQPQMQEDHRDTPQPPTQDNTLQLQTQEDTTSSTQPPTEPAQATESSDNRAIPP